MNEAMQSSFQIQENIEKLPIEDLETEFHTLTSRFKTFLNRQEDMEKRIMLDNPWAGLRETSISEMVLHVVNHGTYHRGNISAMLHQLDDSSVMTLGLPFEDSTILWIFCLSTILMRKGFLCF